ncbi:MAG: PaaX family transcriptional regulator C-terminal domain-containing protein [Polyangiaceae bacterium]
MPKPSPRDIILKLLLASGAGGLSARDAVAGCALFGIAENSARVALVRLVDEAMIEAIGRGAYSLGPKAANLAADVATWRNAEQRVRTWRGDWLAVHTAGLKRADRAALRGRERAMGLLGLRELEKDLFLRPNNLAGGADAARERLHKLDADFEAPVFVLRDLDPRREKRAQTLWNSRELNAAYAATRRKLEDWVVRAERLDVPIAARESYVLGDKAIRQIIFDPLLPEPLVDVDERKAFHEMAVRFDRMGHAIWQAFLSGRPSVDATHHHA